jgi:hypothetical protein
VAEGVGVAAGVDVAGTLAGDGVAVGEGGTVRCGVAVADGCTVRCGVGVGVADLVGLAGRVGRGLAGAPRGPGVSEAAGCTGAGVWTRDLACAGGIIA